MNDKKVVVLLKYSKGELNPFDASALEAALCFYTDITVVSMAPPSVFENLKMLTRLGVKAILVSDKAYSGSDTVATSLVLKEVLEKINPDYVFCGRKSIDGDTAQVPPMLSERLGYAFLDRIMVTDGETFTSRDGKKEIPKIHTIITFEKGYNLRFPSIFSKSSEVQVWDNTFLKIPLDDCGILGSPTRVIKSYENTIGRRFCRFIKNEEFEKILKEALKENNREIVKVEGERLNNCYYIGNIKKTAEKLSKEAIEILIDGKSVIQIAEEIRQKEVKTLLFSDDEEIKVLASRLAIILNAGLCADCVSFSVKDNEVIMTRPAQSGNITADISIRNHIAMATVKTAQKKSKDIVFCVGNGATQYIDKIKVLAEKYGGELCCSRIVADSGKLPYEMQVGLTGKMISPKVYIGLGISGAVQHTCGIEGAQKVIAVNINKSERIFDYADYGIVDDCSEFIDKWI